MNSTQPPVNFDAVGAFIDREYVASRRLAGAQLIIQHRDAVYRRCFGCLDREGQRPVRFDSLFRIYSMTKPVTCVAFMQLVEAGKVALEDPVARYIPSWSALRAGDSNGGREMRIADLLTHTSGLTYGLQYRTSLDARYRALLSMQPAGQSLAEFVATLSQLPLEFEPGAVWNYSVSTDVLGYLIETLSGMSFRDYLIKHIFLPLGMQDTDFSVNPSQRARLAECYVRRDAEALSPLGPSFESDRTQTPTFLSGGGGLISTGPDYLKFCNMLLNRGRPGEVKILSGETLKRMSTNQLPEGRDLMSASRGLFAVPGFAGVGFGLGWATTIAPDIAPLKGNHGDVFWSGMANTSFWCDPKEELIGIFMTQILPAEVYPLQRQVRHLTYEALEGIAA
jgi:CubicO group peptidase (beta-lactamase class C family)